MWTLTIVFALAGLALRADGGSWLGPLASTGRLFSNGLFVMALLACPFLWARSYGFVPRALMVPAKERLMFAMAMILAIPLVLPWH